MSLKTKITKSYSKSIIPGDKLKLATYERLGAQNWIDINKQSIMSRENIYPACSSKSNFVGETFVAEERRTENDKSKPN